MKKILCIVMMLALMMSFIGCDFNLSDKEDVTFNESESAHVHSFEYVQNAMTHFKQYTCGCPSPDIAGLHYDNDKDELCDECGHRHQHAMWGMWQFDSQYHWCDMVCNWEICDIDPALIEHSDEDSDDFCDVCGYEMLPPPPPTNHFLRNQAGLEWLNDISAEDIVEIKIISETVGVAPGAPRYISVTYDDAVIARLFEDLYRLDTAPIPKEEGMIDGGGAVTFRFTLNNGAVRQIYINNGNYCDRDGNYFELSNIPSFKYGEDYVARYGFLTYQGTGEVMRYDGSCEPENICIISVDELEFVPLTDDIELDGSPVSYYVDTEFGRLCFIEDAYFYIEGMVEGDPWSGFSQKYFQLVGKNIDELIAYATSPDYSVTMNDPEWLKEELKPTYKAGDTVTVRIDMATDTGYLFLVNGEKVDSSGWGDWYWEFTFTMPECDVVIDFKTYDGFLPHWNYSVLIETYWLQNLSARSVWVKNYYGEFESGAIVAMIEAGSYDDAIWEEKIEGVLIRYPNSNGILVLYDGEFYTLTEAYWGDLITPEELAEIADLHEKFYTYLYK